MDKSKNDLALRVESENQILQLNVFVSILVSSCYLIIYMIWVPHTVIILATVMYILLSVVCIFWIRQGKYDLVRYTVALSHFAHLTLTVFWWLPVESGVAFLYILTPATAFQHYTHGTKAGRRTAIITSVMATTCYIVAEVIRPGFHLYETTDMANRVIGGFTIIATLVPIVVLLWMYSSNIHELNNSFTGLANTDVLTGILNRRALTREGSDLYMKTKTQDKTFSILLFDIDYFKRINDTYGHPVGDIVLVELTELIRGLLPREAVFARYGGEEFAILAPRMDSESSKDLAESLLRVVSKRTFSIEEHEINITVSIGVVSYRENVNSYDDMLQLADKALYRAKMSGRNRVVSLS